MYRTIEEFLNEWKHESGITQTLMNQITDASLTLAVSPKDRTLGQLAAHIADSITYMCGAFGIAFEGVQLNAEGPTADAIKEAYRVNSERFANAVKDTWTDATLGEKREIFGMSWSGADFLYAVLKHEVHHRGQLSVLVRQAGLKVPDIYGPARQD